MSYSSMRLEAASPSMPQARQAAPYVAAPGGMQTAPNDDQRRAGRHQSGEVPVPMMASPAPRRSPEANAAIPPSLLGANAAGGPPPRRLPFTRPGEQMVVPHSYAQLNFPEPNFAPRRHSGIARTAWVVMAVVAVAALAAPLMPSTVSELLVAGVAYEAASLCAALVCYVVSQRMQGQAKLVWSLGALAAAVVSLAQLSWVATLLSTGNPPAEDAPWRMGMLAAYPPVLVAMFFLTVGFGRWTAMLRRASDCALIAGSVLVTTWGVASTQVREQVQSTGSILWGWVLGGNLTGVLLAGTLTAVVLAHRRVWRDKVGLVVVGVGLLTVVDGVQALVVLQGWPISITYFLAGSSVAMLLIATAAFGVEGSDATAEEPNPSLLSLMLPYACLLLAMGCLVTRRLLGEPPEMEESLIILLLVVTVLLRHILTATETHRLLSALANREQVMRHQALHDPLTGLANRALFTDRVEHAVTLHARSGQGVVVMFCDLDDFKEVNDSLGHAAGDALLVAVAARMREVVRAGDTVSRLGGDEFALLIEQPDADVTEIARRLLMAISAPLNLTQAWVFPSVSIGSAFLPPAGPSTRTSTTATRLLGDADEAMYVAKASGKGRHAGAVNGQIALSASEGMPYDPLNVALPVDLPPVSDDPTVPNPVPSPGPAATELPGGVPTYHAASAHQAGSPHSAW